jgi:hypothetical protein
MLSLLYERTNRKNEVNKRQSQREAQRTEEEKQKGSWIEKEEIGLVNVA